MARFRVTRLALFLVLAVIAAQLLYVQVFAAPELSERAAKQRTVTMIQPATRGSIVDRNGQVLAYTREARALTFQPGPVRELLAERRRLDNTAPTPERRIREIAAGVSGLLGGRVAERELLAQMRGEDTFVYLARGVDPAVANQIREQFPEVGTERQDIRQYPGGAQAANILGSTGWDGKGLVGMEAAFDSRLAGVNGSTTYDRGEDGAVIPGSTRDEQPAVDGETVELTLDADLQYFVQQQVQSAKERSGAQRVIAVVMDTQSNILAMANDNTFNPALGLGHPDNQVAELGNPAVSTPFEPGSIAKIITAATVIEDRAATPDEVLEVPGKIDFTDFAVKDAWDHDTVPYTVTGVFGKSSNVGTLMLSDRVGHERMAEMLWRFGVGLPTGVELPGESPGTVPPLDQWNEGTIANIPIGQGFSVTALQMAGIYQTIANNGVRIPPRIVKSTVDAQGNRTVVQRPEGVEVVSPTTAKVVRDMFRAVTQNDPEGTQRGTGWQAAVDGYQISGKTGTAQQVDPACGCYSNSKYWITFAGIAPADNPRYVIALMLDAPVRGVSGQAGQSAAPLFHNIAAWLLRRDNVPASGDTPPMLLLDAS